MNAPNLFFIAIIYTTWISTSYSRTELSEQIDSQAEISTYLTDSIETTMITNESLFQQVPLDTNEQTACSPADPGINWRGIVIRAPSHIALPEKGSLPSEIIIPICGLYLVDVANTFRHPGPKMLIVVDDKSGQIYKGALVKRILEPTVPPPPTPPVNRDSKAAFGDYFNVNAAAYVTLPTQAARYRMRIEYAGYQSNEVTITVRDRY